MNSNLDLESTLSIDEKNAYKALIEGVPLKQLDDEFDVSGGSEFFSDSKKSPFEYGASDVGDNNNTFFYPEDDPSTVNNNHMVLFLYLLLFSYIFLNYFDRNFRVLMVILMAAIILCHCLRRQLH